MNGDGAITAALNWLAAGLRPDAQGRRLFPPEALAHVEDDSTAAFASGQALSMRNWPVAYRILTEAQNDDRPILDAAQVGVTLLPGAGDGRPGVGILGGQSLAVAAGSDQPAAAQRLIAFLTNARSQQRLFADGGFVPTRTVVYGDDALQDDFPYLADLRTAIDAAQPQPVHPRYELLSEAIRRVVHPYLVQVARGDPQAPEPVEVARELARELAAARDGLRR